jgi:hypothetical protein
LQARATILQTGVAAVRLHVFRPKLFHVSYWQPFPSRQCCASFSTDRFEGFP